MPCKNGGQKQEWRYPAACVGSYFIPDENIHTYLICLQSCNMQKHQKANFRTAEYVCVQQWWLKVSITHISWPVTSWNTHSLPTCTRSTMRSRENTVAINNNTIDAKIWTPKLLYYFLKGIKSAILLWNMSTASKTNKNKYLFMIHDVCLILNEKLFFPCHACFSVTILRVGCSTLKWMKPLQNCP